MKNPDFISLDYYNKNLKDCSVIVFENPVSYIEPHIFENNKTLSELIFDKEVGIIGDSSFESCKNLSSVTFRNKVRHIDTDAFRFCDGLENLTFGGEVTSIGTATFSNCALKKIDLTNIKKINFASFAYNQVEELVINTDIQICDSAFAFNNLKRIHIDSDPSYKYFCIENSAFSDNEINNIFCSAHALNFSAFNKTKVKNFYLDLSKLQRFTFGFFVGHIKIDNLILLGKVNLRDEYKVFMRNFLKTYKGSITKNTPEFLLSSGYSLSEFNNFNKQKSGGKKDEIR